MIQTIARFLLWCALLPAALGFGLIRIQSGIQAYDKELHLLAFTALTIFVVMAYPRLPLSRQFAVLIALGCLTEALQMLPGVDRQADWMDLSFNIVGITITLGVIVVLRLLLRRGSKHDLG